MRDRTSRSTGVRSGPPILQNEGLPRAVQACCEQFGASSGVPVSCDADESVRDLSGGASLALFGIVQKALGNAAKHAAAKHIAVRPQPRQRRGVAGRVG